MRSMIASREKLLQLVKAEKAYKHLRQYSEEEVVAVAEVA